MKRWVTLFPTMIVCFFLAFGGFSKTVYALLIVALARTWCFQRSCILDFKATDATVSDSVMKDPKNCPELKQFLDKILVFPVKSFKLRNWVVESFLQGLTPAHLYQTPIVLGNLCAMWNSKLQDEFASRFKKVLGDHVPGLPLLIFLNLFFICAVALALSVHYCHSDTEDCLAEQADCGGFHTVAMFIRGHIHFGPSRLVLDALRIGLLYLKISAQSLGGSCMDGWQNASNVIGIGLAWYALLPWMKASLKRMRQCPQQCILFLVPWWVLAIAFMHTVGIIWCPSHDFQLLRLECTPLETDLGFCDGWPGWHPVFLSGVFESVLNALKPTEHGAFSGMNTWFWNR